MLQTENEAALQLSSNLTTNRSRWKDEVALKGRCDGEEWPARADSDDVIMSASDPQLRDEVSAEDSGGQRTENTTLLSSHKGPRTQLRLYSSSPAS